jgi:hypothetical protein
VDANNKNGNNNKKRVLRPLLIVLILVWRILLLIQENCLPRKMLGILHLLGIIMDLF